MVEHPDQGSQRMAYWQARRRRRLLFIIGRFVVLTAVVAVIAWFFGGGRWMAGAAVVAGIFLVLRLAMFWYNGRHLEERIAQRGPRRNRFSRP